jgi:exosortase K
MDEVGVSERASSVPGPGAGASERDGGERRQVIQLVTVAGALALAWWLKAFYSRAGFDDLRWLLDPTVRLAEAMGAGPFELEARTGWLSRARNFMVAPACAGMNFLIAAQLSLAVGLVGRCQSLRAGAGLLVGGAIAAWATTVLANALRITLAIQLHASGAGFGPFTPDHLHELLGIGVYFLFLVALFVAATRIAEPRHAPAR